MGRHGLPTERAPPVGGHFAGDGSVIDPEPT